MFTHRELSNTYNVASIVDKHCMVSALKNPELNVKNKFKMRWYFLNKGVIQTVWI